MRKRQFIAMIFITFFYFPSFSKPPKEKIIEIKTDYGNIYIWLYKDTPIHRENFLKLAGENFFDSTMFHRVIQNFMIQGGDPYSKMADKMDSLGEGGPGYELDAEFRENHWHKRGVIAAARNGDDVNPLKRSAGSQFYIVQGKRMTEEDMKKNLKRVQKGTMDTTFQFTKKQKEFYMNVGGTPWLDKQYTVFGEVIRGMEVVDKIAAVEKIPVDRPKTDIRMDINIIEMSKKELKKEFGFSEKKLMKEKKKFSVRVRIPIATI